MKLTIGQAILLGILALAAIAVVIRYDDQISGFLDGADSSSSDWPPGAVFYLASSDGTKTITLYTDQMDFEDSAAGAEDYAIAISDIQRVDTLFNNVTITTSSQVFTISFDAWGSATKKGSFLAALKDVREGRAVAPAASEEESESDSGDGGSDDSSEGEEESE